MVFFLLAGCLVAQVDGAVDAVVAAEGGVDGAARRGIAGLGAVAQDSVVARGVVGRADAGVCRLVAAVDGAVNSVITQDGRAE